MCFTLSNLRLEPTMGVEPMTCRLRIASERNSRLRSRRMAQSRFKRTRQSAARLEIRSCISICLRSSIGYYQLSALLNEARWPRCHRPSLHSTTPTRIRVLLIHFWGERELPVSKEKASCSLLGGFSGRLVYRADELRFKRSCFALRLAA